MKAIQVSTGGGAEVLKLANIDSPKPGYHELLIEVKAAGINRSDVMVREKPDTYGGSKGETIVPGLEVAGIVKEVGDKITSYKVGDEVCALLTQGGYAEEVVVNEKLTMPVPGGLSFTEAASLPEVVFTVWFNVFQQAKIEKGEKLLIHGGTSGIGIMGLQMAKAMGMPTYSTAGTDEKVRFLTDLGVDNAINYKKEDFSEIFKNENIDVILDMVGGDYTRKNLDILAKNGRLCYINGMKGLKPEINLWTIMSKNLILTGSLLKPQSIEVKAKIAREVVQKIWPLLEDKSIEPVIHKTFPLAEAADAHRLMESSDHIGKIVLVMEKN
ncbi:NAD(P)H-quinone oxidoreductase [Flavimarina sp. Hel_I_48]|uniref:NAD(P)H-quinone oxidoreductase n=1 Tax=Flavimarina sp. Hel_I_48 TaxID=1392488 RepID=UPI0004DF1536|nr:NAD(P)H-quinone oxidoreductase [Flavimarina sp. Hel_I_48]